jgi:hypothetical protein
MTMTAISAHHATSAARDAESRTTTPTEKLLTSALLLGPLIYLAADSTYAARGWTDPTAGVLHVFGAIAYGFVILRIARWLPRESTLSSGIILVGLIGLAGNVAYGFDTIHTSLGDTPLVDQSGAANLIKPLGFFFPLSMALVARALAKLSHRWQGALVLVASIAWPIAHIGNIAALAVAVNITLVVAFGSLIWSRAGQDAQTAMIGVSSLDLHRAHSGVIAPELGGGGADVGPEGAGER